MGYLPCPVCERESLANVSDLQLRVATALTRPLPCPICSASVSGLQAFHHHLAAHLPAQLMQYSDAGTPPSALNGSATYPPASSPEAIPMLERLDINDGRTSPHSPATLTRTLSESRESTVDRMTGVATTSSGKVQPELSPTQASEHTPSQPQNCDLCGLIFSSEHFLKIHKDIIHTRGNFFDVTCKLCKKKFKDFEAYRNHVREDHSDRRYMCDQCPKTFKMKGSLLVHTRMFHDPASPGTCHVCKKTFTTKARKELHEKRYHGIGIERLPSGKMSPPSPSTKQQKTKNSTLGDAKNWLETLMNENKTSAESCSGQREPSSQQQHMPQSLQHQPESPPQYSPSPTVKQKADQNTTAEYQSEHQFMAHQQNQHQSTEQLQSKEHLQQQQQQQQSPHMQHSLFEAQQLSKLHTKEPQDQNSWGQDVQPYMNPQDKTPPQPHRSPSEMYFPPYKNNIVFPCQVLQQNMGVGRPRLEYSEFKEEKKVAVSPHASVAEVAAVGRMVGSTHSQNSPVAVVSPQPHKAETPPTNTHAQDAMHTHTDIRRNSFPLMNFNKLGLPQGEPSRLHPGNYINELSLAEGGSMASGQALGIPGLGEKIQSTLAVSQQLVYQHCHSNMMPSLSQSVALLGTDSKAGLRVPPLLIPTTLYPTEKMKESPDSPVQMDVQKEAMVCEVRPTTEGEGSENTQEIRQEKRGDQGRPQRPAAPTSNSNLTRKDSGNGKADNKQWECEVCKKSFTTKYFLKKHKRLHTGETPYACAECGKTFTFQQSYHKHILYHSDDKPHQCSYCGRAFKEMSTLHNHVRIHTGEKPFVCETCGKAFRQRVSYLVHQRIHTGVMPYTCDVCGRSFRYKVSLRSHKCEPGMAAASGGNTTTPRRDSGEGRADTCKNGTSSGSSSPPATPSVAATPPHPPHISTSLAAPTVGVVTPNCGVVTSRGNEENGGGSPMLVVGAGEAAPTTSHHHQQEVNTMGGRMKSPLETIDLAAISCESLSVQQDGKRSPHKTKSASQGARSSSSGSGGSQACQDPLSMAFLHALVDPQQGRLQSECRPHVPGPQDALPFPSLSPGAMDTDMDHDSFLTNLLM